MAGIGKVLIIIGAVLIVLGIVIIFFNRIPLIGKLPGDIYIKKENYTFYFPLTTCILVSIVLSLVFWMFKSK
ncbi:MAG: DUF2905 domain-containing protein [Endomicrobiales bacterium]|nr:DUF2905 domain-containing protein [Endomicrobiales bacterium]